MIRHETLLSQFCDSSIKNSLRFQALPRVGFMTYDSKVHFYNVNKGLSQPQQMSVGDVGDMFVPLVEGFLVDASEAEAVIDSLVEQIPVMFGETRETETILGPVIQAAKEAFKVKGRNRPTTLAGAEDKYCTAACHFWSNRVKKVYSWRAKVRNFRHKEDASSSEVSPNRLLNALGRSSSSITICLSPRLPAS